MLPTQPTQVLRSESCPLQNWRRAAGVVLLIAALSVVLLPAGSAWADDAASADQGSEETGIKVAAWAVTVPYIIAKGAFAVAGAVVGALGYLFSGLDDKTAKAVWTRSIYGTYIIRPAHLRGEEAVRFLAEEPERRDDSIAPLDQPPAPSAAPGKDGSAR
jgi:hypothetical protein